nr:hypothetical protein [Tanacetum cinerariifolium]
MNEGVINQSPCITRLPDDPLYVIFEKLKKICDRESFGLTCHRFLDIQNLSCRCLNLGYMAHSFRTRVKTDPFILDQLLSRFTQLESLSLTSCYELSDSDLTILEIYGSKLRALYLSFCPRVTDISLNSVASGCQLLSIISLSNCSITDSGLEILTKSCKSLIEVNLAWCLSITDHGIRFLIQNCRQLKALKISWCNKIVGVGFQGCSAALAHLQVDCCAIEPMGISQILSGGGLEYLSLCNLNKCTRGHGLGAIGSGVAANLKILDLKMCTSVTDDAIISISKGCPLLQEWNLSFCDEIGYPGWESIGLYCDNLKTLHVNKCVKLCDRGLLALGNGCKRLSVLYMTECLLVTRYGIRILKTLCL